MFKGFNLDKIMFYFRLEKYLLCLGLVIKGKRIRTREKRVTFHKGYKEILVELVWDDPYQVMGDLSRWDNLPTFQYVAIE